LIIFQEKEAEDAGAMEGVEESNEEGTNGKKRKVITRSFGHVFTGVNRYFSVRIRRLLLRPSAVAEQRRAEKPSKRRQKKKSKFEVWQQTLYPLQSLGPCFGCVLFIYCFPCFIVCFYVSPRNKQYV
jgi:hypothetical protein